MMADSTHTGRPDRVRIGVSTCLLGEEVRYDGGHKRDALLVDRFGRYVEWVPVCPEVEVGMGTPRDFMRLVDVDGEIRMMAPTTDTDHTDAMIAFARRRVKALARQDLSGYIFKKSSPSCGVESVKIYRNGMPDKRGTGLFASAFIQANSRIPVEEEGRLQNPRLRENFVSRVFAYDRWKRIGRVTRSSLTTFHAAHKLVLLAHNQEGVRRLGALLGRAAEFPSVRELADAYWTGFTKVMRRTPTRRSHTNVLQHLAALISDRIDTGDRAELTEAIERYRLEQVPLIVPVTLIRHYVRRLDVDYLNSQVYLDPHPDELMLLNQI